MCPYSASKSALETLTRNVAYSVLRDRIRVNGIIPGWIDTPEEHAVQSALFGENWKEKAEPDMPFGRLLTPLDIARAVAFLLGDESGILTGSTLAFNQFPFGTSGDWRTLEETE